MHQSRIPRLPLTLAATAVALWLIWGAHSVPAPVALLQLQAAAPGADPIAPGDDAGDTRTWSLGIAP